MRYVTQHRMGAAIAAGTLWFVAVGPAITAAQENAESVAPKTHTVERGPFKIGVELEGTFEAKDMTPVVLRPDTWSDFTVIEAVEQGKHVRQGETLVQLDMTKIDQAIADIEVGQELAYLSLRQTEEEVAALEKSVPLDLQEAERSHEAAQNELEWFLEEDRALSEEGAHQSLKSMRNYLENQLEELRQLEKMYSADDLTEETEEIILKRQRDAVESAQFSVKRSESRTQRTLEFDLPQREQNLKTAAMRDALALEKARVTLPATLRSKQLELAKARYQQKQADERLERLKADREQMNVTAPVDGIVYYGNCVDGKWTNASAVAAKLRHGGKLAAHEVFITLVQPRPVFIRTSVSEKDLRDVRSGATGAAAATAHPDVQLPVNVDWVSPIPTSGADFDARLSVELPDECEMLMPGMTCKVTLTAYEKEDAVTVPAGAVFTDEEDEERHYVLVELEDAEHEQRTVELGRKTDKVAEILEGLEGGEKILTSKPEDAED